ncbi:PAS domain-containing protein [Pedobacter sp. LMG 31464]|uniref:histidine kinase n=1 Tax=Pedobacter planticolens TaxID=2679964 RepID=A0A923IWY8_9SPHI|nr:ATP-binding protein [Pedobacter planticolens]MBB2145722.1 PAS domain-containing protein [Pedobacter planticolens]
MIENTFGKNIIPANDPQRLVALKRYRIMDSPSEESFDNIVRLCTQIFEVPISLVSLVDAERVFFKANVGMGNAKEANRGKSLCALAVLDPEVTVFEDALKEPCLIANPNVAGEFGLRFYAGAPLTTHDGFLIGTLCVIDKTPRIFSKKERQILAGMAAAIMDQIELRLSALEEIEKHQTKNAIIIEQQEEMRTINEALMATNEELKMSHEEMINSRNSALEVRERLEIALDASKLGSTEVMLSTGVMNSTPQFKANYGYGKDEPFTYPDLFNAILPDHRDRIKNLVKIAIDRNDIYKAEYPVKWRDGSIHWISAHGRPRYDKNGKVDRMVGMTSDITESKLFEQRKDDFLSIASHELKTPVTSLKASLQLLNRIKDNPTSLTHIKLIEQANRSMEKMDVLVSDLLNMNRMAEGQLKLDLETFSIAEMLQQCCNHIRVGGKYELIIEGDSDLKIHADQHRIDQVVVNFVNNAVKYAPKSLTINLKIEKQGSNAKISVTDKGPGISPETLPHLFDRYYRASYESKNYSGLGLGLYICSEIIKRHDGEIGVESQLGKGSTFWFTIPINLQTIE